MFARRLGATLAAGTEDATGILLIRFPILDLPAALSSRTVKRSLKELEGAGRGMKK